MQPASHRFARFGSVKSARYFVQSAIRRTFPSSIFLAGCCDSLIRQKGPQCV